MTDTIIDVTTANTALNTFQIDQVSLHSGNPSNTGENEITSAGYSRQSFGFAAASGGKRLANTSATFNMTTGDNVSWVAYWYQGDFTIAKKVEPTVNFTRDGTFKLDTGTTLEL